MKITNKILLSSLFLFTGSGYAASTSNYYRCYHREGGDWNYGRTPDVCDASAFGEDRVVYDEYPGIIFLDQSSRSAERTRFITETNAMIRDAARYYIRKRKPSASDEEVNRWTFAIQLVAAHESRMSHYRKTIDTRLKMVRGDSGHGHGMMQIDDRAHFNTITSGVAWNLITNLTYGMDVFFEQWQRAPSQSCVGSATDWAARTRSAWAAYNGGPGSICRWKNTSSAWAENDRGFYNMYNTRGWLTYVADANAPASVDARCLIENFGNCPAPGDGEGTIRAGVLYRLPNQSLCSLVNGSLHCVAAARDAICLYALGELDTRTALDVSAQAIADYPVVNEERHVLCKNYDPSLIAVGSYLKTQTNINVRSTPGGGLLGQIASGQVASVLDFELRNHPTKDRYYQIQAGSLKGYVYAGDQGDQGNWVIETTPPVSLPATVAQVGGSIRIVTRSGINMRGSPGGQLILGIPSGATLKVEEVVVQGTNNEIFYRVSYSGRRGYIYSGYLKPTDTVNQWTKVL
jgi:hypothetical protein